MNKYSSFGELSEFETLGQDFRVLCLERPNARMAIVAPHGGLIEVGTSEIATLIAGGDHSLFCFEGLKVLGCNRDLHITSHRFDHPDCLALAARHDFVVSVHGCRGRGQIFIGGLDVELGTLISMRLRAEDIEVVSEGHRYPGLHPDNVCNRGLRRRGAQIEITSDLRAPAHHARIAQAIRAAIADARSSLPVSDR